MKNHVELYVGGSGPYSVMSGMPADDFYDLFEAVLVEAAERVFAVNEANGWFEDDRTVGDDVALLHSEVSEMFEAYREHGFADQTGEPAPGAMLPKPEGFGSEVADTLIRLLDTSKRRGVWLGYEFARKLEFNKTRGHKHGGKLL